MTKARSKQFDRRLRSVMIYSGKKRENLARFVGVAVSTVNHWLSGTDIPNVYQFHEIAHYFGLPYEWFLDGTDGIPCSEVLARQLGLSVATVEKLAAVAALADDKLLDSMDRLIGTAVSFLAASNEVRDE